MSWYITITPATGQAPHADTARLIAFLASLAELRQTGPIDFSSAPGFPWVSVIMALTGPTGGYAHDGAFIPRIDIVELVCPWSDDTGWHDALASRIAAYLGWVAIEAQADRQVWPRVAN